jgi:TetR/AcrR family transcriptional regulator, tetracycline repressor protein
MEPLKLNRDTIVAEAIRLLNEEGLDGVSLRKLGARLGIKAPSLYWHFPDKSALLSAVMEKLFNECLDAVPETHDWQEWMRAFGSALWRRQNSVRDFGRLITSTDIDEVQLARTSARLRDMVRHLNLQEDQAMRLQSTIQALVTGWSAFAHAPYAKSLPLIQSFEAMVLDDLETVIAGQSTKLQKRRRLKSQSN